MSKDTSEPRQNLVIKASPPELVALREQLAKPWNSDILEKANKEATFEACLGAIAAELDIALDGTYDPLPLIRMLAEALSNRHLHKQDPEKRAKGLVAAKMEEHDENIHLEFARMAVTNTHGKEKEVAAHTLFMLEHDCEVCHDRNMCKQEGKCLGTEFTKKVAHEKVQLQ